MGKNWAITIGINGYHHLQRLYYAQRDAEAMRDYFRHEVNFQQVYHFSDDSPPIPPGLIYYVRCKKRGCHALFGSETHSCNLVSRQA